MLAFRPCHAHSRRLQSAKSICQCAKFVRRNDQRGAMALAMGGWRGAGCGWCLLVFLFFFRWGGAACLRRDVNQRFKCFLSCQRQRGNFVCRPTLKNSPQPPTPLKKKCKKNEPATTTTATANSKSSWQKQSETSGNATTIKCAAKAEQSSTMFYDMFNSRALDRLYIGIGIWNGECVYMIWYERYVCMYVSTSKSREQYLCWMKSTYTQLYMI